MKKKELIKLKNNLYYFYNLLNPSNDINIDLVQFFDEKPSTNLWEINISKTEKNVVYFKNDLVISSRFLNYESNTLALNDLNQTIDKSQFFQLFAGPENSIFFDRSNFNSIIDAVFFFDEDYLLYCYEEQKIITGGFSGFTVWKKLHKK